MFLGPVRGTVMKIFLQILEYELRLCFRLVTKLSDEVGMLAADCGSWPSPLESSVPQQSAQHLSNSTPGVQSSCPQ